MAKTKTRAAIYARKSTEDARNPGKSIADQLREAEAEADLRGYAVAPEHVFSDSGVSASRHARKGSQRQGFADLLAAIEGRQVDVLVMAEQSRAARRMSVIGTLVEMCAANDVRMVIGGRDVDPASPTDLVLVGVQAGMDAAESERIRERCLRGARGAAQAGKPAGKNMYGYERTYDPNTRALLAVEQVPEEAAIVREIVQRILAGDPLNVIAADLNRREVPSPYDAVALRCGREPKGATWVGTQVRRIATSPAYAGLRVHRSDVYEATWAPIVSRADHERVVAILTDPSRRSNGKVRPGAIVHWLSGVAKCGLCGSGMRVLTNRGRFRNYVCPGCMKVSRAAGPLEEFVAEHVFGIVEQPQVLAAIASAHESGEGSEVVAHLDELTARRDGIRALMVSGQVSPEDGAAMLSALGTEIADTEAKVRSLTVPRNVADLVTSDLRDRWESFTPARKREVADALLDVTVQSMNGRKSSRFDPTTVTVSPKGKAA